MNKIKVKENIIKNLLATLKLMLINEIKNNEKIISIYVHPTNAIFKIYIFCNDPEPEFKNNFTEQIYDYIYYFIKYKLNYETFLPEFLIKNIREYIGYNRPLFYFNFEGLPKNLTEEIDKFAEKIFPAVEIKYYPNALKSILPHDAIEIKNAKNNF